MDAIEKVVRTFQATLENAMSTAIKLARTDPQLAPHLFFVGEDAQVEIVLWDTGNPPYADKEIIRKMVRERKTRALVYVGEIAITVLDDKRVPDRMEDGIIVAGFYKGVTGPENNIFVGKMWKLDWKRKAIPWDADRIPSNITSWMPEVFELGEEVFE